MCISYTLEAKAQVIKKCVMSPWLERPAMNSIDSTLPKENPCTAGSVPRGTSENLAEFSFS